MRDFPKSKRLWVRAKPLSFEDVERLFRRAVGADAQAAGGSASVCHIDLDVCRLQFVGKYKEAA